MLVNISGGTRENGTLHGPCKTFKDFHPMVNTYVQQMRDIITVYGCTSNRICITNPNVWPVDADISCCRQQPWATFNLCLYNTVECLVHS